MQSFYLIDVSQPATEQLAPPATGQAQATKIRMKQLRERLDQENCERGAEGWTVVRSEVEVPVEDNDWEKILGEGLSRDQHVVRSVATLFADEPDHNRKNAPRLDIVLTLNDGVTIRYHPKAYLIKSTEQQPTDAMLKIYNLARKLRRRAATEHA